MAAKRPPFYGTFGNYGREVAAFLNWASGINKWATILDNWKQHNCGREAATFFYSSNCIKTGIFLGQLGTTSAAKRYPFYWTIGNYGREAAAFFNCSTGFNNKWVIYWAQQLETIMAAKRPPFNRAIGNYGREAAAFLNWETAVLHLGNCKNWVTLPLLLDQKLF